MTRAAFEDAQKLFRSLYAANCFRQCAAACKHITDTGMETTHPIYYTLMTGAFALYARPFEHSSYVGGFDAGIVPTEELQLHERLINVRDKILVHNDPAGFPIGTSGEANQVVFISNPDIQTGSRWFYPRPPELRELMRLAERMVAIVESLANEVIERRRNLIPQGRSVLNVTEQNKPFTKRP